MKLNSIALLTAITLLKVTPTVVFDLWKLQKKTGQAGSEMVLFYALYHR